MSARLRRIERIERNVDRAAAALFAAACGYAAFAWFSPTTLQPVLAGEAAGMAVAAYLMSVGALGMVKPAARKEPVPIFDVRDVEAIERIEVPATETADEPARFEEAAGADAPAEDAPARAEQDALVLDDILAALGPDSRVVRLFDPASMPSAGELKSRIDRHLDSDSAAVQSDATQALHDALAELRRSIR